MSELRERSDYVWLTDDEWGHDSEHRIIAMRAIGGPLPQQAQVHHVNGDRSDNRPQNLVVCEDQSYHLLLHRRQDALSACGHADWEKCCYCDQIATRIGLACPQDSQHAGPEEWMYQAADAILALLDESEPVAETLYYARCGWCGAYEGTVNPAEPCARDNETGEYIGPHQFGRMEQVVVPLYASPTPTSAPEGGEEG